MFAEHQSWQSLITIILRLENDAYVVGPLINSQD